MTANYGDGGAKIYKFPKGGRAGLRAGLLEETRAVGRPAPLPIIYDGGWYHDAAIREDRDTPRKQ